MTNMKSLCETVRQTAYAIHIYHGTGHLEKVYENALAHRLRKAGLSVEQQYPLTVYDEDGRLSVSILLINWSSVAWSSN